METFKYEKIRNVALLGHGGCGKTALVEAMAFTTGTISRQGKVEDGSTVSDFDKEEAKRQFSISTSVVPVIWEGTKINLLDTPGYFDFIGEVEEALHVADAAVIVISAKTGVEVGTMKAWELCERFKLPRMFFVTDMDDNNASYRAVVEKLEELYGRKIAPFQLPIRENEKFAGYVNVVKMKGRRFTSASTYDECEIPEYSLPYLEKYRDSLNEAVAETSEDLMEKYFNGEEFTKIEMSTALRSSVVDGSIIPVLMGSGMDARGSTMLMDAILKYFPAPNRGVITGINTSNNTTYNADYDANKEFSARVFKTIVDPFIGKFSLIKVCSGILSADTVVMNTRTETEEKISRLYVLQGKTQIEVKELYAGDIGAIAKLTDTMTGDTLATKECPIMYDELKISKPYTYLRYQTKNKADDAKVSQAIAKMLEEDRTLKVVNDKENHQTLLYGIGDQHLEVVVSKLLNRYKVELEISKPKVPYRETISKKVKVQGKHKKQSGGHGQYGDVHIEFEPSYDLETPFIFEEKIFGGAVPKNYFPAVEKGLAEGVLKGPLAGYPVVGIKATLVDGSYHAVDSSEMAFKMATLQAFKQGIMQATPILLEPIVSLEVIIPDTYTGEVMGDLNKRRGRVLGMDPISTGKQKIIADVPLSELFGYSTTLRSIAGGTGEYSYEFSRYDPAPADVQARVIEESSKEE